MNNYSEEQRRLDENVRLINEMSEDELTNLINGMSQRSHNMNKYTRERMLQMTLEERVSLVNSMLQGSSLKQVINNFTVTKGALKELLKPYEYNVESRQFELLVVKDSNIQESRSNVSNGDNVQSQNDSLIELLSDIKNLLQNSYTQQEITNKFMLQIADDVSLIKEESSIIKDSGLRAYKPRNDDELMTRSFKIYDSINERLKSATKNSDLNQQQLFNSLLDKALMDLGW